jgi:ABC-2 type transport system permease protein
LFAVFLVWGIYALSLKTFLLLESIEGLSKILIDRLIHLFFFSIFFMLVLSCAIWGYITLYKTEEVKFLFTLPLEQAKIFGLKFLETVLLSGWAFLFLSLPFMFAYGSFRGLDTRFYLYLVLNILPLFFLCGSLGILLSLILVRFFPQKRRIFSFIIFLLLAIGLFFRISRQGNSEDESFSFFLTHLFPYIKLSQNRFLPSFWVSEGLMELSFRRFRQGLFWWPLLLSNALFFTLLSLELAKRIFYSGWEKLGAVSHSPMKIFSKCLSVLDKFGLRFLPTPMRGLVSKDIAVFGRSPEQNLQFLFFFGLLALYFSNLKNLSYHTFIPKWKAIVLLLNIMAVQLTLGSLVIRFVFPQIGMEGKRFWILSLSPLKRKTILWEKFFLSWGMAVVITLGLVLLSNANLDVEPVYSRISFLITLFSSFTITAISCGLGTFFANYKEDNPAAIVSGFGGTFTLVLTLFYIVLMLFLISPPFYLYLVGSISREEFKSKVILSGILLLLFSFLISFICLLLGKKKLEKAEF